MLDTFLIILGVLFGLFVWLLIAIGIGLFFVAAQTDRQYRKRKRTGIEMEFVPMLCLEGCGRVGFYRLKGGKDGKD